MRMARAPAAAIRRASGRSYEDSSPYKVLSQLSQGHTVAQEVGFFKRSWVEPKSVLDQAMVARLCTGKYRTTWKEAALMKDPISLVQYTQLLQKVRPKTIFDLGTCGGGSALWFADQCRALNLDTTVVTIDIEDLRAEKVKDLMALDPKILFFKGDAFKVDELLKAAEQKGFVLEHPWLVAEDCHLDSLPLMTQFRLAGMRAGDYWVFEDTHIKNPDEAGMSAETEYSTGNFAWGKYQQLCWAMTSFPDEYVVDSELQDFFGHNGSLLVNSILKQVDPPCETVPSTAIVCYSTATELEEAKNAIEKALGEHGLCLLRAKGKVEPAELLPALEHAAGIMQMINYGEVGGTDLRNKAHGSDFIFSSEFPSFSHIPPHHELLYTPHAPQRIGFVCLSKPESGGDTTVFDSRRALDVLKAQAEQCAHHRELFHRVSRDRLCYSRVFDRNSWSQLFGSEASAAVQLASEMGYEASFLTDSVCDKLRVVYTPNIICPDTGALQVSAGAQGRIAYDVFYRDPSATASHEIFWESDKQPLKDADLMKLLAAYAQCRVFFQWQNEGDAILLNNKLFAHGRMPYRGKRKVAIVMGNVETK